MIEDLRTPFDVEGIEEEIKAVFRFTDSVDSKNIALIKEISECESVAVHVRVLDFKYGMKNALNTNYYEKALKYIQKKINIPLRYYFFSDEIQWCKDNYNMFGIEDTKDTVFVDNNKGSQSFRDMQLMQRCKHIVCPNSTFSWMAGFLNDNKDKIVVTPIDTLPGTVSF